MALNLVNQIAAVRMVRTGPAAFNAVGRRAFSLLTPAQQKDATLPQFMVGTANGFLPRQVSISFNSIGDWI
jgi:hypothetical protein